MVKVLITIPPLEMTLDKLPDDMGSLDNWVYRALRDCIRLKEHGDNIAFQKDCLVLSSHGLNKNPFSGRLWKINDV